MDSTKINHSSDPASAPPAAAPASTAVVILAGGDGRRIGGGKPLVMLGGRTLLDRSIEQARQWSDRVALAVRDQAQLAQAGVPLLLDEPAAQGPLAGLWAALRFARQSGAGLALTLPTDTPFLPSDLHCRLQQELGDAAAAIAASGGRLHPTCGLWRVTALAALAPYAASGGRSLTGFAEQAGMVAVTWPAEPLDPFFNINTAEQLAEAQRRMSG